VCDKASRGGWNSRKAQPSGPASARGDFTTKQALPTGLTVRGEQQGTNKASREELMGPEREPHTHKRARQGDGA
jgi:hypothetical protein